MFIFVVLSGLDSSVCCGLKPHLIKVDFRQNLTLDPSRQIRPWYRWWPGFALTYWDPAWTSVAHTKVVVQVVLLQVPYLSLGVCLAHASLALEWCQRPWSHQHGDVTSSNHLLSICVYACLCPSSISGERAISSYIVAADSTSPPPFLTISSCLLYNYFSFLSPSYRLGKGEKEYYGHLPGHACWPSLCCLLHCCYQCCKPFFPFSTHQNYHLSLFIHI